MCIQTALQDRLLQILIHCAVLRAVTADETCSSNESQHPCWHAPTLSRTRPQEGPFPGYRRQHRTMRVSKRSSRKHASSSSGLVRCLATTCRKQFLFSCRSHHQLLIVVWGVLAFVFGQLIQKRLVIVVRWRIVHENRHFFWSQREDDKFGLLAQLQVVECGQKGLVGNGCSVGLLCRASMGCMIEGAFDTTANGFSEDCDRSRQGNGWYFCV